MNVACLENFTSDVVKRLLPYANATYITRYWPIVYMALDEQGLDYEEMMLMALATIAAEVRNFNIAVSKIKDKVDDLYDWHNKTDGDGIPLWYVRRSLEESIRELGQKIYLQIEVQTKILRHLERMEQRELDKIKRSRENGSNIGGPQP